MSDPAKATQRSSGDNYALARQLSNAVEPVKALLEIVSGTVASAETQKKREDICRGCSAVDATGKKLFRAFQNGIFTCGPIFLVKPFRTPQKDGCGCVLNLKWMSQDQSCPLGHWDAAEPAKKRRCCGRK